MGDQPVTKTEFDGAIAGLTGAITALTTQMTTLSNNVNNNRINPNRGGERIPVIRVRNNNQTIVTYIKSEHTRGESDLEYYERRYYKRLKDDYYTFKISDSTYRCPFCCNKDYSLSDLLRHAYRMSGNLRKTIKDIAKHSVLITYINWYVKVKFDEAWSLINNSNNNNHANNFQLRHIANETLDDNQPSHPEKLDDSADKSKPKETEVVVEPDVSVEGEESKDENKEADEVEQVHDVIRDSQHDEVVDFGIDNTKSAMVSNVINPNVQSAPLICVQTEATPVTDCIVPASKYHNKSMVAFERIMDAATETQISENEPLEVDTWSSQTSLIQHHYYYLISELDVSDTNSYMLTKVGQTSFCDKFPTLYAIFEEWDPGGNLDVLAQDGSSHFTQWDPGGWSLVHWRNQLAREAPYQDENSGSSSFEVEETDVGGFLQYFIILVRFSFIIF
ncbi:unnamed protein product [Trifolium pratense]|uniref:Uncharacterized protein n=1 Tax=Trifolium pratense TaxID=57577 RepID=A0ACB0LDZ6_TRIPR|nr:unnamed protein product [Trifolium pratense]